MTQAFVCPSWSRRVASLGKMPECWDGVSEDSGDREVSGEAGACSASVPRCFCLQLAHPGGHKARSAGPRLPGDPGPLRAWEEMLVGPRGRTGKTEISAEIEKGCDLSVSPCGWVCGRVFIPLTVCPLPGTCPALPGACDPFNAAEAVPCGVWGVRTCRCLTS